MHLPLEMAAACLVSLEGCIGAGKSTLMRAVSALVAAGDAPDACAGLRVLQEPVAEWCAPALPDGRGMLQAFYADPERCAFAFQMFVLLSRLRQARAGCGSGGGARGPVLSERCIASDYELFGLPAHEAGRIGEAEWVAYGAWVDEICGALVPEAARPRGVVYMRCPPEVSLQRVARRNRDGEQALDLGAARAMHDRHEEWVARLRREGTPVLELDCSADGDAAVEGHARAVCAFVARLVRDDAEEARAALGGMCRTA